ncbi:MAG: glycosyltransferase family 4 protein [Anaerolineae bacterium]|nr:glycosyltransferase family 4 protein [Anaerolineae bacterium]
MNIVFIGPFGLQPKATMRTRALWLGQALVARGHKVTMLIPPWDDPERAGQQWDEGGVRVVNTPLPSGLPGLFHILLTRTLVSQALALEPDIIHFFKPKAYAGLAHFGLWWLRRLRGGSFRLVLDTDDWEQAWNELSPYSRVHQWLFTWQERWGLAHADAVTVASREIGRLAQPFSAGQPVVYVPNGWPAATVPGLTQDSGSTSVPEANVTRQRWQVGEAPIILLYPRFVEFQLERIVTQVWRVAELCPAARWLIVGQGLRGEEKSLEAMLAQARLSDRVRFTGWLAMAEVQACIRIAIVAVYPYDDTLINRAKCSVKLIDLLAHGLPVVADAVGQNREYIETNRSGLLVAAEDDEAFAQAIVRILADPELGARLGQRAARQIQQNFTWPVLAETVECLYAELI